MKELEVNLLDLRYESYRMRNHGLEVRLLNSISERGIEEPLEGIEKDDRFILLNGFKRYRCAKKLGIGFVPFKSLGEDEATGIISLIKLSNNKSLGILEQAIFIEELRNIHNMNLADIAETFSRSKSWASMRIGLIGEMGEKVREKIFSGAFPVYAYMYTIKKFMRMNEVKKSEAEEFILAVSGKKLSVREIEYLANGYFQGPESLRQEIRNGNIALPLNQMEQMSGSACDCNNFERSLLRDLELAGKYMRRIVNKSHSKQIKSQAFYAQANILTSGLLNRIETFEKTLKEFYERS